MQDDNVAPAAMRYRTLGKTQLEVSVIGFGASPMGNVYENVDPAESSRAVHFAIDQDINFFGVSPYYGLTLAEEHLGQALDGRRKEVILATKCGRYGADVFNFSGAHIREGLDASLKRLRTDYVDLLKVHDVEFGDVNQIIHGRSQRCDAFRRKGRLVISALGVINASGLHMGILTDRNAPDWHPTPTSVREAGRQAAEFCRSQGEDLSELALQFCFEYPRVASTLVGMSDVEEVRRNLRAFYTSPKPEVLREVRAMLVPVFNYRWPSGRPENQDVFLA